MLSFKYNLQLSEKEIDHYQALNPKTLQFLLQNILPNQRNMKFTVKLSKTNSKYVLLLTKLH